MEWFAVVMFWYITLFFIGLIFVPITKRLFPKFEDFGYPFAKTIGIGVLTYAIFALSTYKILSFSMFGILTVLIVAIFANFKLYKKSLEDDRHIKSAYKLIVFEELLFFGALLLWTYVRSHQPEIRGLEKFMDYGFIKSSLNADYFPAKDMWLAGKNINYYYFGHITGAFLTKLSQVPAYVSYNLILATIFAQGITQTFSLGFNIAKLGIEKLKNSTKAAFAMGLLTSFIINFGGNLHTIYAFFKPYNAEKPIPFWQAGFKSDLAQSLIEPHRFFEILTNGYWYPNATRFIPFTIHEFPLYSYVVADLHGHVFDIPFVLLTLALLYSFLTNHGLVSEFNIRKLFSKMTGKSMDYVMAIILGFMMSIHFMTNAFDAPIYLLLFGVFYLLMFGFSRALMQHLLVTILAFILFSHPFTSHFEPFASKLGINCAPQFLVAMRSFGPLIFEKDNCQVSTWWMLVTLWGFFWFNFGALALYKLYSNSKKKTEITLTEIYMFVLFFIGTVLIIVPEFMYAKDIYPSHFRANTMFKLGYQAFIMMGLASAFVFTIIRHNIENRRIFQRVYMLLWIPLFFLIALYPAFAVQSYYGGHTTKPTLDGLAWVERDYPEYAQIIDYLDGNAPKDSIILEAQGDSYTDFNMVSAYTGLPTVAGWWVHQWLWRGDAQVVGALIPDIEAMYQSEDILETKRLLEKHGVDYVVIGTHERTKYTTLREKKFEALGQEVLRSTNNKGVIYKISLDIKN